MLLIFVVIFSGILTGRLLAGRRLGFLPRLITVIIWILLFLLGAEVGADPAVAGGMTTLGAAACVIFLFSVAGSIGASWTLWRWVRRGKELQTGESGADAPKQPVSRWVSLRGSLVIVAFFVAGCMTGLLMPGAALSAGASTYVLYALMYCVGITLGHDTTLVGQVRRLDGRLALLPAATLAGTLAGAVLAAPLVAPWSAADSLAVGAGLGYYSLSSLFIAGFKGPELATVALLCNVMREIFTLLCAPLVARWAGPLAAVSIGGATTFDTTLPIITRAAGSPYAVVAVFHGCMLDFSVPFLVTLFCTL